MERINRNIYYYTINYPRNIDFSYYTWQFKQIHMYLTNPNDKQMWFNNSIWCSKSIINENKCKNVKINHLKLVIKRLKYWSYALNLFKKYFLTRKKVSTIRWLGIGCSNTENLQRDNTSAVGASIDPRRLSIFLHLRFHNRNRPLLSIPFQH